jgi:hypothetical protein
MAAIWEPARPEIDTSGIVVATPVGSREWKAAAFLANFLHGKGACLVPTCAPHQQLSDTDTSTFRFWCRPRKSAIQRVWLLTFSSSTYGAGEVSAPPGVGTATVSIGHGRASVAYVENLSARSNTEQEISIKITAAESETLTIETISCWEMDRAILNLDTDDYGVDVETLSVLQPIRDADNTSIGGVVDALENADARRVSLFQWSLGDGAITSASSLPTAVMPLDVPILAAKQYRTDTSGKVCWRINSASPSGAAGGFTRLVTSNSGVSDLLQNQWGNSATNTYYWGPPRVVSVDCEDLAEADGRPGATWDDLNFYINTAGGNTVALRSLSVYTSPDIFDATTGTFARAGTAWRQFAAPTNGSSAFIEQVSTNVLRTENWGDGLGDMLALETVSFSNSFTNSENITAAGGWSASGVTLTVPNTINTPDGATDGTQAVFLAGATNHAYQTIAAATNSQSWRITFWAKMGAGSGSVRAFVRQRDGATNVMSSDFSLSTTWKKCEAVLSVGSGVSGPRLGFMNGSDGAARTIHIWGIQCALDSTSSGARGNSYIRTTGTSASSVADSLTFASGTYPESFLTAGFAFTHVPWLTTAQVESRSAGYSYMLCGFGGAGADYVRITVSGVSAYLEVVAGGVQKVLSGPLTGYLVAGSPIDFEIRPSEGVVKVWGGGGYLTTTGTAWTFSTGVMSYGGRSAGTPLGCGGRYSRYIVGMGG